MPPATPPCTVDSIDPADYALPADDLDPGPCSSGHVLCTDNDETNERLSFPRCVPDIPFPTCTTAALEGDCVGMCRTPYKCWFMAAGACVDEDTVESPCPCTSTALEINEPTGTDVDVVADRCPGGKDNALVFNAGLATTVGRTRRRP